MLKILGAHQCATEHGLKIASLDDAGGEEREQRDKNDLGQLQTTDIPMA